MLKVYSAQWCPHCELTIDYLTRKKIPFEVLEIEQQPQDVVHQVVKVNGGDDWVVPTLEYNGRWRPGKVFDPVVLEEDLCAMGLEVV